MGKITAILPQKKDKNRCNIYLEGQFYCGLSLETVILNRLKEGQEVNEQTLNTLQFESEKRTALDKALTHISASMKTKKELSDYLRKKGYLQDVIDYVLKKMSEYGFADDEAYAKLYAENAVKNKGKRLIELELQRKGVSADIATRATEALQGESEGAAKILEKYMRHKEVTKENLYKAFRHLLSKGYDYETAKDALSAYGETE